MPRHAQPESDEASRINTRTRKVPDEAVIGNVLDVAEEKRGWLSAARHRRRVQVRGVQPARVRRR